MVLAFFSPLAFIFYFIDYKCEWGSSWTLTLSEDIKKVSSAQLNINNNLPNHIIFLYLIR